MIQNALLFTAGCLGGFIAGLSGVGTGIVMLLVIPLVIGGYNVPPEYEVASTIAHSVLATTVASLLNLATTARRQQLYLRETLWIGGSAVAAAIITFEYFVKTPYYSPRLFNGVVVLFLSVVIVQTFRKLHLESPGKENAWWHRLLLTGGLAGTIAALTGLGGGTVSIPMLNLWMKVDIHKAKSISFGTILAISFWLTINNLLAAPIAGMPHAIGLISIPLSVPILAGVILGSPMGVVAGERVAARWVTVLFLTLTIVAVVQKVWVLF